MFIPQRILFEKNVMEYEIAQNIYNKFKDNERVELIDLSSNRIKQHIPGDNPYDFYRNGKNTLVVGTQKVSKFQTCKPSAHYQLPLLSGCMGHCQYCYLNTNLSDKPYIKINANIDDILNKAQGYINERLPAPTIFEGSSTSDPVPIEPYSTLLKRSIEFFANNDHGRFRFVTKFADIDSLLDIKHNNKTEIRFTINTQKVRDDFEKRTANIKDRINASVKCIKAGYPVGFIIAPVFIYENWKDDYKQLLLDLKEKLPSDLEHTLTFEVISHRYTTRAKNIINEVFPDNTLPMTEEERTFKYGQFGYGKYVYPKEDLSDLKEFFKVTIEDIFPTSKIKYII
ncbi:MAG: spore photoproduct lyase [Clostridium perfringens]|nr:spore photoproduct lyase [Clostridium perfringens]